MNGTTLRPNAALINLCLNLAETTTFNGFVAAISVIL